MGFVNELLIAKLTSGASSEPGAPADGLAAPSVTAAYDRVPIIKRNTYGKEPSDFNYAIATQGASEGTVPLRSASGSVRINCSDAIAESLYNIGADTTEKEIIRDQMAINYGYFKKEMSS